MLDFSFMCYILLNIFCIYYWNLLKKMKKLIEFFRNRTDLFAVALRFAVLNFVIFSAIGIYYRSRASLSYFSLKSELYTIVIFFGLPGCLSLIMALVCSLFALISRKVMYIIGAVLSIFCISFLISDAVVFTQYNFHIDGAMLSLFFSDAGPQMVPFSLSMFLTAAAGFIGIAAIGAALMFAAAKLNNRIFTRIGLIMTGAFAIGTLVFHLWHAVVVFQGEQQMLERNRIFPCNIGMSAKRLMLKLGFKAPETPDLNAAVKSFAYPRNPLVFKKDAPQYNVIFIIVDALRGDMIVPEVMPYFSKFVKEGAFFRNHLSNGNCTRVGVFSVFSGIVGPYWEQSLISQKGSVMIDSFIQRGYQSGVFFSSALTNPEFDRTIFANIPGKTLKRYGSTKIERDKEAAEDLKKFILQRDRNKPLLGVLMFSSLHGYETPADFKKRFEPAMDLMNYLSLRPDDPDLRLKIFNMLKNATAYSDTQLEDIIGFLRKELDWEKTILVITSDHGNECNENSNNIWGHNSKFSRYQLHVPLVLAGGPIEKGEYNHRTFHVDIAPTLMQMTGCENPVSDYSSGKSLYDKSDRDLMIVSSYSNRAMLYGDFIYEMTKGGVVFNYTLDEKNIKNPPSAAIIRKYFDMLSHFTR